MKEITLEQHSAHTAGNVWSTACSFCRTELGNMLSSGERGFGILLKFVPTTAPDLRSRSL